MPVLVLAATAGLTAGCTRSPTGPATSAAAAPSPSVDMQANTAAVCKAVVAAYKAEEGQLLPLGSAMAKAALSQDQQQIAKVKAETASPTSALRFVPQPS
jgi:hypothetical protein